MVARARALRAIAVVLQVCASAAFQPSRLLGLPAPGPRALCPQRRVSSSGLTMKVTCSACRRTLPTDSFSKNQASKGSGARCHACVHGGKSSTRNLSFADTTARLNRATRATFKTHELDNPFAQGAFRWVARGKYTHGERAGEDCVCKWFKSGVTFEEDFFKSDIHAVDKAEEIIRRFNAAGIIDKPVYLNKPEVWTFDPDSGPEWAGVKVLQEPFIEGWQKFNSNTGWVADDFPWPRAMQALSHFSYHVTAGACVLCDVQGGVYSDGVVLSDPVILSRQKEYGVTDLGPDGISTFFARHRCNEFCRKVWNRPRDAIALFPAYKGTSMMG